METCDAKHGAPFAILSILFVGTCAYAQVPDTSPERTTWDHNGSAMYLIAKGSSRELFYEKPRPGMLEAGAKAGSLYSEAKSVMDNTPALPTSLIFSAGRFLSPSKEPSLTAVSGLS